MCPRLAESPLPTRTALCDALARAEHTTAYCMLLGRPLPPPDLVSGPVLGVLEASTQRGAAQNNFVKT
jgi:hypothetical protein